MVLGEILKGKRIILGSASPRRKELFTGLGVDFEVIPSEVEEEYTDEIPINDVPEFLAKSKSLGFQIELDDNDILITADTLVICEGIILGKPKDRDDAYNMLRLLSGKEHIVKTGVCIRSKEKISSFTATTIVNFRELSDSEIYFYIDNYSPFDKAGSYGVQEWIGYIGIVSIHGSYYNVMGLPTQLLNSELINF